ncbi:MAG: histidinol dehydrogenase, partial [Pseudomonadota bacterium]
MPKLYLKRANRTSVSDAGEVRETVAAILADIAERGDPAALEYTKKFDKYDGNLLLSEKDIAEAAAKVPDKLKEDIQFAHDNVRRFAEQQKSTVADIEYEVVPGMTAGQKAIPVDAAGCYVPAGRYRHIASAIMTVTTA